MTTTTQPTSQKARLEKIADRILDYSQEIEDFAADVEEGPICDALFEAARSIDNAASILDKIAKLS